MAISLSGAGSKIATDSESEPKDTRLTPSRFRTLSRAQARWRSRRLSIAGLNSDNSERVSALSSASADLHGLSERLAQQLEQYLAQNPNAPDAAAIRQRIAALRAPAATP